MPGEYFDEFMVDRQRLLWTVHWIRTYFGHYHPAALSLDDSEADQPVLGSLRL